MRKIMTSIAIAMAISGATAFTAAASATPDQGKITICHVPPGNPENAHAITIDRHAWENGSSQHSSDGGDFVVDADHQCPAVIETTTTTSPEL